jgi:hypothetical protein
MCGETVAACECQQMLDMPLTQVFRTAEVSVASHGLTLMLERYELAFALMQYLDYESAPSAWYSLLPKYPYLLGNPSFLLWSVVKSAEVFDAQKDGLEEI